MGREDAIYRMLQDIVAEHISQIAMPEVGIVQTVDKATYTVTCMLPYDQVVTGKLRVAEMYTGNGFGITNLPKVNDEVLIVFQGGRPNDGFVVGRLYGQDVPPQFSINDWMIRHERGSKLTLKDGGDIELDANGGSVATMTQAGVVTIRNAQGTLTMAADGKVTYEAGLATFEIDPVGKFKLANSTAELLAVFDDLLTQLTTAQNILGAGPPAAVISGFNPAVLALMQVIQTKLRTLKT